MAQAWATTYETALRAAQQGRWMEAREGFRQAIAYRPEDTAAPTVLPGPVSEQRRWRGGAPYSPNFLAAYSGYRAALEMPDNERGELLTQVVAEFEALLAKGQLSPETFYFLNAIHVLRRDTQARMDLERRFQEAAGRTTWRVDAEGITPEELAVINEAFGRAATAPPVRPTQDPVTPPTTTTTPPGQIGTIPGPGIAPIVGHVAPLPNKFAIIIGNSTSQMESAALPYGAEDAQRVREALVTHAGYLEENVDLILNASSTEMRSSVQAMADRIPEGATVFIYFAGAGFNLGGRDYLAGAEAEFATDANSMVAKNDIYRAFMAKGAHIFAFFQAHRPIEGGRYFGAEVPMVGAIAQTQSTIPGAQVFSVMRGGRETGLFTEALVGVLANLRSNQIPILEFGWQIYNRIRRGDTGQMGGGSIQVPTLPVLINMATDARF
jgi:hypothetical protein